VLVKEMMSSAACKASSSTGASLRPHTACAGLQAVVIEEQQWDDSEESDGGEFDGPPPPQPAAKPSPIPRAADVLVLDHSREAARESKVESPDAVGVPKAAGSTAVVDIPKADFGQLKRVSIDLSAGQQSRRTSNFSAYEPPPSARTAPSADAYPRLREQRAPVASAGFALRTSAQPASSSGSRPSMANPGRSLRSAQQQHSPIAKSALQDMADKLPKPSLLATGGAGRAACGAHKAAASRSHVSWLHFQPGPAARVASLPAASEEIQSIGKADTRSEEEAPSEAPPGNQPVEEVSACPRHRPKYRVVAGASRPMAAKTKAAVAPGKECPPVQDPLEQAAPRAEIAAATAKSHELMLLEFRTQPRVVPPNRQAKLASHVDGGKQNCAGKTEARTEKMRFRPAARTWARQREALAMR